ncbi:MAG: hypothetical protein WCA31_10815 [Acidimicrobiales bacterium]
MESGRCMTRIGAYFLFPTTTHDTRDRGSSLTALLSVLAILAILAVIALSLNLGSSPTPKATSPSNGTTTTAPKTVASGASEATVAACEANFNTVLTAVATYRTLNGSNPPAGTTWATSGANGGPLLQSWPNGSPAYRLAWNGETLSVVPARGTPSHGSVGEQSNLSGCFANKTT